MNAHKTITELSHNLSQFKAMKAELDRDIARTVIACTQAGDAKLMGELVGSVSNDHEFSPLLIQLALEMASGHSVADEVGNLTAREDIYRTAVDVAEAYTNEIDHEALMFKSFFGIALAFVPQESLTGMAGEMLKLIREEKANGLTNVPSSTLDALVNAADGKVEA